ncbi:hydrolase [Oceanisphaera pacifica]|uniref:Hydrolase n=1 Tax=Oceanisphaera pacifica TaxID=2818389 RepID=A0ABS3NCU5_9GAMM|nr:hydrolase [Oceanisphaera pacifica]MBO1518359.1 hydrolase [Oceanisphaera pacifica]
MIHTSAFQPPWWARNSHIQTIFAKYLHRQRISHKRERLELPDGDFVDLAWGLPEQGTQKPLVVLFHGLEGSIESHYIQGMMAAIHQQGWQAVLMHFRGCSGEPNRFLTSYHSGATEDPHYLLTLLRQRYPERPIAAIGYSLGGNMLINYLAKHSRTPLCAAAVVSAPLQLSACADRINLGLSRCYQGYLLKGMKENWQQKLRRHPQLSGFSELNSITSLREFDDKITAPVHGFSSAQDYYQSCSGLPMLEKISTQTLIIHAADDPFMDDTVIPDASDIPPAITYELSRGGGHLGFIQGSPWRPHFWLNPRITQWLVQQWPPYLKDKDQ